MPVINQAPYTRTLRKIAGSSIYREFTFANIDDSICDIRNYSMVAIGRSTLTNLRLPIMNFDAQTAAPTTRDALRRGLYLIPGTTNRIGFLYDFVTDLLNVFDVASDIYEFQFWISNDIGIDTCFLILELDMGNYRNAEITDYSEPIITVTHQIDHNQKIKITF